MSDGQAPDAGESRAASETGAAAAEVRSELRRLGYLDHQVERFLLQDALRRTPPWRAIGLLALKVALLIGVPSSAVGAVAIAAGNGHLRHSPFDVLPLTLHLMVPAVLGLAAAFLILAGLLALLVRLSHSRRIEALSFALALLAAAGAVTVAVWQGRAFITDLPTWISAGLVLLVPVLAWGLFTVAHGGLLSLAIRLTEVAPEPRFAHGRWWVALLMLGTFLVMLPTVLDARRGEPRAPAVLPEVAGDRVLVIGVDGVLPQEVDFLLASGELETMAELLDGGARLVPYRRPADVQPITFWTTLATGLPASEHGLESLDTYRPMAVHRPIKRSGVLRHWWQLLTPALVEYRPLLASQRRSWAFWELAARGGAPALVVNWWGTFPVEPGPGRLIAHGGYQLLGDGSAPAAGVAHPAPLAQDLARRAGLAAVPAGLRAGLEQVLPDARDLLERALLPDVFYRDELLRGLREVSPRTAALYLPGLDIAADAELGTVAFGELVRFQLREVDALLADPAAAPMQTVLLVFDPGRRGADEGRALLFRRGGCDGEAPPGLTAPALTSGVLRALGLPHNRQLPDPPSLCTWSRPSLVVDGFGPRRARQVAAEGKEYLESLQSLGYL